MGQHVLPGVFGAVLPLLVRQENTNLSGQCGLSCLPLFASHRLHGYMRPTLPHEIYYTNDLLLPVSSDCVVNVCRQFGKDEAELEQNDTLTLSLGGSAGSLPPFLPESLRGH